MRGKRHVCHKCLKGPICLQHLHFHVVVCRFSEFMHHPLSGQYPPTPDLKYLLVEKIYCIACAPFASFPPTAFTGLQQKDLKELFSQCLRARSPLLETIVQILSIYFPSLGCFSDGILLENAEVKNSRTRLSTNIIFRALSATDNCTLTRLRLVQQSL